MIPKHGEAFMLMTYKCSCCGHQEIIWNSRDGVTPFGTSCPSCGRLDLMHVSWHADTFAPEHKLHKGQRFWRDGTADEAEAIMRRRIDQAKGSKYPIPQSHIDSLIKMARDQTGEFQKGWPMLDMEKS